MYNTTIIVGMQFGDEGKGRVVDYLARDAGMVVRYQGGGNSGHTVRICEEIYKLHVIPSGILNPNVFCVIGNGVVLDIPALVEEIEDLRNRGISITKDNLKISDSAHVILSYHKAMDAESEKTKKIGTTLKGIGPAYADKISRNGIRVGDLFYPNRLRAKLEERADGSSIDEEYKKQIKAFEQIRELVGNTQTTVQNAVYSGVKTIFEGAQATFLDIDHGNYPFTTSSSCSAGGACTGSGIGPTTIKDVIGITKAYTTRVGNGPFVTELSNDEGERICEIGKEYGTTTGRKRRCGWLDLVMLKQAVLLNGVTKLAITKIDVLDTFKHIRVCISYDNETWTNDPELLNKIRPIYTELDGWNEPTSHIKEYEHLPQKTKDFLSYIERHVHAPIEYISVGAERESLIVRPSERA